MGFFDAFYFMSYTATTIGFGEIPYAFTDAQRMWVTISIYLTVIGWAYAIGSLLALSQDRGFRQALALGRFTRKVARLREPFLLIAGYGQTGELLARSLDALGRRVVVIDSAPERDRRARARILPRRRPGPRRRRAQPAHLRSRGSPTPLRRGDRADQRRRGQPGGGDDRRAAAPGAAGDRAHGLAGRWPSGCGPSARPTVVNPFDRFGDHLRIALRAPASYQLIDLAHQRARRTLPRRREPPRGRWVICGYGRFGREVTADLRAEGLEVTVIEPAAGATAGPGMIVGNGTEPAVLAQAKLETAVGLVAATDNDITNLSLIAAAHAVNPDLFLIGRQNDAANAPLFRAIGIDFALIPSRVIAQEVLARITSPLLFRFLAMVPAQGEPRSAALVARLTERCGEEVPALWRIRLAPDTAPALAHWLAQGRRLVLGDLLRDAHDRSRPMAAVPLLLVRADATCACAPVDDTPLGAGDEILLAGLPAARRALDAVCQSESTRDYVLLGRVTPSGTVWRWIERAPG